MNIAFIGGGNMATALITGLAGNAVGIAACDPDPAVRARLSAGHGIATHAEPGPALEGADAVVLAVKPQVMDAVLDAMAGRVGVTQLVVSVAAGIPLARITAALGARVPVVRAMPNTPALLGAGVTGLFAGAACEAAHRALAERILGAVGATAWVADEALMDVVTALSGSGPAYFYLLAEALQAAGERLGLPPETARLLASHTAHGAGRMALEGGAGLAELRRRVTSPGGTTAAAIAAFEAGGFAALVDTAMEAAVRRGRELATGTPG